MSLIQGVSYSYYGEPICIAVIDCGAAGAGSVEASVLNVQSGITFTNITLSEICSNPGVFFGCVDTAYFAPNSTETVPPDVVVGEFGDELRVQYTSSRPISGQIRSFSYSSNLPLLNANELTQIKCSLALLQRARVLGL
mgnify:CR=1 FL=1